MRPLARAPGGLLGRFFSRGPAPGSSGSSSAGGRRPRSPPGGGGGGGGGGGARGLAAASAAAAGGGAAPAAGAAPGGAPPPRGPPRICVLGGGFGGLYTAVKLQALLWPRGGRPEVTLVDRAERFTFKPLLYELLAGAATEDEVAPTYAALLAGHPGVRFVRGAVAAVRPNPAFVEGGGEGRGEGGGEGGGGAAGAAGPAADPAAADPTAAGVVVLEGGAALPYDWLVLALGAETATYGVPGARELALPFATAADCARLRAALDALAARPAGAPAAEVAVVGGGYAGVELAAALAARLGAGGGRVRLVTAAAGLLEAAPEGQRAAADAKLRELGVEVVARAAVERVDAAGAGGGRRTLWVRRDGASEALDADVVAWAAGQAPAPRAGAGAAGDGHALALPFPADARGATRTEATLRVCGHPRAFALGDVAVAEGGGGAPRWRRLPATAQVAFQQADYVAWNLWAALNGKPLLRFAYQHLGDMMSLGPAGGAVSLPLPVPPPLSAAAAAGPLGALLAAAGVRLDGGAAGGDGAGVTLEGPLAAALRRAAYLYRQPTDGQRARVAAQWLSAGLSAAAAAVRGRGGGGGGGGGV